MRARRRLAAHDGAIVRLVTLPIGAAVAVALLASPARAQSGSAALDLAHDAAQLRPGQWVWAPEISPNGPVVIYVDLSRQRVSVYRNGVRIGVSTASSGRRGYETPTGAFTVLQKSARHRSNRYNNAPMPYMIRLTWDGVALHGGAVNGRPVSHGCIRLPLAFARELFAVAPMGGTVVVVGDPAAPADGEGAGVLAPVRVGGEVASYEQLQVGQSYSWRPEASYFGPVTVVMSRSDQHVVVLRNGVEIGRARASIPADGAATLALTLSETQQWTPIPLPGQDADAAAPDAGILDRVRMAPQFEQAMRAALAPGSTVLVTQAPVVNDAAPAPASLATASDGAPTGHVSVFDTEE